MPINLHACAGVATLLDSRRRGRGGARVMRSIPEARLRPAGCAPGSERDRRAGAQEERRSTAFRVTPGGEHHQQLNGADPER